MFEVSCAGGIVCPFTLWDEIAWKGRVGSGVAHACVLFYYCGMSCGRDD